MNPIDQKLARKIGEVLAFSQKGAIIFQKGDQALQTVLDPELLTEINQFNATAVQRIEEIAQALEVSEVVNTKAEATGNKLQSMQDLYLQDEWDDPIEIMEWLGFFEGAAIVHWALVNGKTKQDSLDELVVLSDEVITHHQKLLQAIFEVMKNPSK